MENGRNGDHVSTDDPNWQRRVLDRSCHFHDIKSWSRTRDSWQKSHTSSNMPAIGTPPRFTEFSVRKTSTRLNSYCISAVVDHARHGFAVRHLSLTPAERAAVLTNSAGSLAVDAALAFFFQWVTFQCQLFHRGELLIEVFTFHTRKFEVVLDCAALRRGAFHGLGNHWLRVAPEPVVGRVCLPNVGQHRFVSSTFLQKFWWCRRRCWQRRRGGRTLRLAHLCVVSRESTVLVGDDCAVTDLSSAARLFT